MLSLGTAMGAQRRFLGGDLNVDEQKKNLITFYREQVRTGNLKNYTRIDLSYRDQVIATRYAHIN